MPDTSLIGYEWPEYTVEIERGQVVQFARALGEKDAVFLDREAAHAKGFRDIPILPTFLIALSQSQVELIYKMLELLEVDPASILHGEQKFVFHQPVCVGDILMGTQRIGNLYDRKNGALSFIETVTTYKDSTGVLLCENHCTLISQN